MAKPLITGQWTSFQPAKGDHFNAVPGQLARSGKRSDGKLRQSHKLAVARVFLRRRWHLLLAAIFLLHWGAYTGFHWARSQAPWQPPEFRQVASHHDSSGHADLAGARWLRRLAEGRSDADLPPTEELPQALAGTTDQLEAPSPSPGGGGGGSAGGREGGIVLPGATGGPSQGNLTQTTAAGSGEDGASHGAEGCRCGDKDREAGGKEAGGSRGGGLQKEEEEEEEEEEEQQLTGKTLEPPELQQFRQQKKELLAELELLNAMGFRPYLNASEMEPAQGLEYEQRHARWYELRANIRMCTEKVEWELAKQRTDTYQTPLVALPPINRSEIKARADYLYGAWAAEFELEGEIEGRQAHPLPDLPANDSATGGVLPAAPHLEDCAALTAERREAERRGADGALPAWAASEDAPQTPWVEGADADNLPLTRVTQRDLWAHQFPADCDGKRFLVVDWMDPMYGIGSALHIMTSLFSHALVYDRILVINPVTFERANHDGCQGPEARGRFECYFFRSVSEECEARALGLLAARAESSEPETQQPVPDVLAGNVSLVNARMWGTDMGYLEAAAATRWGERWAGGPVQVEILGHALENDTYAQVKWWRSQATRFLLRWPSEYLCRLTNRERHRTYGRHVARAEANAARAVLRSERRCGGAQCSMLAKSFDAEAADLRGAMWEAATGRPLERTLWAAAAGRPFLPRPIVSIHVRQGDKGGEMRIFSFDAYMWLAERLRLRVPGLRNVWLSTEMQNVVDEARTYKDWRFFSSPIRRQQGTMQVSVYEDTTGRRELVGTAFANLLISSQCDYFVGALGSNWNRLINELRLTNGRAGAGYLALNFGEW